MYFLTTLFWVCFFMVGYAFVGYGIILYLLFFLKRTFQPTQLNETTFFEPLVTLVVPCFNEGDFILDKVVNCQQLDYPADKLSLVFITDGSTDNSHLLLQQWPAIKVLHENRRSGKTAAENRAMKFVDTPFVIFSDANTMLNRAAVKNIVRHFYKDKVACVSGEKRIISDRVDTASAAGEGIYWKYESLLKRLDSDLNTAVGAAGEVVGFRTSLCEDLPEDTLLDDFMQSMQMAAAGYKIAYEPDAFAVETASENVGEELKRKIRICAGGWQSISRLYGHLRFARTPLLYFQYFSHRVLRWTLTPFLLIMLLFINILLAMGSVNFYSITLLVQVFFYIAAFAGFIMENRQVRIKLLFVPYYFCMMNYAAIAGLYQLLSGNQKGIWEKARRKAVPIH